MSEFPVPPPLEPLANAGPVEPIEPEQADPPWSGGDVVLIALVALIAILLCSIVGLGVARMVLGAKASLPELGRDARLIVPVQAVAYAVVVAFMYGRVART